MKLIPEKLQMEAVRQVPIYFLNYSLNKNKNYKTY